MTIEELTEIVPQLKLSVIKKSLRQAGFFDCVKDKVLRHVSLMTLRWCP